MRLRFPGLMFVYVCLCAMLARVQAATPTTFLASITHAGVQGNHNSNSPCISGDGRYVAFVSSSQTLATNKTTTVDEIFLRDNQTGILTRLTQSITGGDPSGACSVPSISADGRYIVFESSATNLVSGHGVGAYMYDTQNGHLTYLVNGQSPVISRDGRFIAFTSTVSTLVPNDTNNTTDVFVMDRGSGQIERESVASDGSQSNNPSGTSGLAISATGRFVAFQSTATDLVAGDTNTRDDVFVRDRQTPSTIRVSIATDGTQGNQASTGASISSDGRKVVFQSRASNLVLNDANGAVDVFLRDTQLPQTSLVSVSSAGAQAAVQSGNGIITPDGSFVTFETADGTLVAGDTNAVSDVFIRDLATSTTSLVSLSNTGALGDGASDEGVISDDGRYVAFRSAATNMVAGDANASTDVIVRGPLIDTPGALAITTEPGGASAGANFASQPVVEARNLDGTVKWDYSGPVTLTIKAGTGRTGAILAGTLTVNAVNGVATFAGLSIDLAGTGYVLSASNGSFTPTDSLPFNVAQTPTKLAFSVQPGGASAGLAFSNQPVVQVLDAESNVVLGFSGPVSLAIKAGTGRAGAVLSGTATVNAVNGVATFSGLSIDLAGPGYVLAAGSTGLAGVDSTPFAVAQTPVKLAFSAQPGGAAAGVVFTTQPVVQVLDGENNVVTAFTGTVNLSIKAGTGRTGAVLSGTTAINAVAGVASFTNLSLNLAGAGYVLTAGSGALAGADSTPFSVAQTATKVVFTTQPGGASAGLVFSTQPQLEVRDAENNLVASYSGTATIAIKTGTGRAGAVLSGTVSVPISGGTAGFTNLTLNLAGAGYVLSASSAGLTSADSATFTVAQTPTKLAYLNQPGGASAGLAFSTQPVVQVLDAESNVMTAFTGSVSVAIKAGTGRAGAILSGVASVNAIAGVATFTGLSIDKANAGYVLTATSGSLTSVDSVAFTVAQTPTKLAFSVQPGGASAGLAFATQPVVQVLDAENNVVTAFTGSVSVAIKAGTGRAGAILSGITSINAVAGVATFTGLSIDKANAGYVLTSTSGALTPSDSTAFSVAQTPTKLAYLNQPGGASAGLAFSTQPVVQVLDAESNVVTAFTGSVSVAIKAGTGRAGAVLSGVASVNAIAGVATFSGLSIDKANAGYVLTATSGSLTSVDSVGFPVAQTPTKLAFSVQPGGASAGLAFATQPVVQVLDAENNVVTAFTGPVTVAIKAGTGRAGAILSGTTTVSAAAGVATFTNVSIDLAGGGYVLTATSGALATADSGIFAVAQTATKLVVALQPAGAAAGQAFTTQPIIVVKDAEDNLVASYTGSVTMTIKAGTGRAGAVLSGTATVTALNGVASFTNLSLNLAGSGYVLTASSGALASVDSAAFSVAQTPKKLAFSVQPGAALVGRPFLNQPVIQILDAENNVVASYTGAVTVAIKAGTGAPAAILGGTAIVNAASGVATFSGLSIDRVATGYVLTASSDTLTTADSLPFAVGQAPWAVSDVTKALRWTAGLATPSSADVWNYNIEKTGTSTAVVDLLDANRIARKAAGVDANP